MKRYIIGLLAMARLVSASEMPAIEPLAESELTAPFSILFAGPLVACPAGDNLSLTGLAYAETTEGYLPTLIVWNIDRQGRKSGEISYQLGEPKRYPEHPHMVACRCPNGDTVILVGPGDWKLIRFDARGAPVSTRSALKTERGLEAFIAVIPDQANGVWLGTKLGSGSRLYHLDERNNVLLQTDYRFSEYTVIQGLAQSSSSDELLVCGISWTMQRPKQAWVVTVDLHGQVRKSTEIPVTNVSPQGYELAGLPGNRTAFLWPEDDKNGQQVLHLRIFDKDLHTLTESTAIAPIRLLSVFSMVPVGKDLAVLIQRPTLEGSLVLLDSAGRPKASREVSLAPETSRHSLAVLGDKIYVAGRPSEPAKAARSAPVLIRAFELQAATQPSP